MIHRKNLLTGVCTMSMLWLGGCANLNSIYRNPDLASASSKSVITDAKQRLVFSKPRSAAGKERNIICAEPSPDVAQALSSAISLAFEKAGTEGKRLGTNAAFSFGDSIAQLGERLAVIQLLRDKMYRACEAYANGAVDKVAYTLMLARLDKTMVTLLSQEMAAGAFGRQFSAAAGGSKVTTVTDNKENETETITETNPTAAQGGNITGQTPPSGEAVKVIQAIYRDYVDDDGTEPLTDACICCA